MEKMTLVGLVVFAMLGFIGWLGGGRKWAFRTMLSAAILVGLGFAGIPLYGYWTERVAEHRNQKIHDCAIAKVAKAHCVPGGNVDYAALAAKYGGVPAGGASIEQGKWQDYKPPTTGSPPGPWQKYAKRGGAVPDKDPYAAIAKPIIIPDVCPAYMLFDNPTPEQEYAAIATAEQECRGEMDPKEKSLHEQISQYKREHGIAPKGADWFSANAPGEKLSPKACAAKVRTFYPGAYDDLDDSTLTKKVLAKYPTYCDVTSSPPDFIPDIKGIR